MLLLSALLYCSVNRDADAACQVQLIQATPVCRIQLLSIGIGLEYCGALEQPVSCSKWSFHQQQKIPGMLQYGRKYWDRAGGCVYNL